MNEAGLLTLEEAAEYKALGDQRSELECRTRELLRKAVVRALQRGKWQVRTLLGRPGLEPVDSSAKHTLQTLMRDARFHPEEQLYVMSGATTLCFRVSREFVYVELQTYGDFPAEVAAVSLDLGIDIDLTAWLAQQRASAIAGIDAEIADLRAKRKLLRG